MSTFRKSILAALAAVVITSGAYAAVPTPSAPKLNPADDSGYSSLDHNTKVTMPRFTGTCAFGYRIYLQKSGVNIGWMECTAQGTYEVAPNNPLADGAHTLNIIAWSVNDQEASPNAGNITVTIDTTHPAAPNVPDLADGSDTGFSNSDNITKQTNPLFYVFGVEPNAVAYLDIANANESIRTGPGSMPTTGLTQGTHTAYVYQVDRAGNPSLKSGTMQFTIDTTAPPATNILLDGSSDSGKSSSDKITKYQQLTLYIPSVDDPRHEVFRDGVKIGGTNLGSLYFTASVPPGDYLTTFTSRQLDLAGNVGPLNQGVVVRVDTIAPSAPTVAPDLQPQSDNGLKNFDNITSASSLVFKLKANDESHLLFMKKNGALVVNADRYGSGDVSAVGLVGTHTYSYVEFDDAGNESALAPSLTVTVVDGKPTANNDAYTLVSGGTITVPAPGLIANDSDFEGKPLTAIKTTNVLWGTLLFNADGSFTYTAPAQGAGTDGFNYKVSNGMLESSAAGVTFNVVTAVPTVASLSPSSGAFSSNHTLTLTGQNYQNGASLQVGAVNLSNVVANGTSASGNLAAMAFPPGTLQQVRLTNPDDGFVVSPTDFMVDFLDVPQAHGFHDFVESIFRFGVTSGCGNGNYCPDAPVTRAQMAVFLLRAKHGSTFVPPATTGTVFNDVAIDDPFGGYIEKLKADGITGGCGGGNYCPNSSITRAQMAVFLLTALEGGGYQPPAASGQFGDVPVGSIYARWIEELADRGITSGCGGGNYCPDAPVTRAQMAVFLKVTFSLP